MQAFTKSELSQLRGSNYKANEKVISKLFCQFLTVRGQAGQSRNVSSW